MELLGKIIKKLDDYHRCRNNCINWIRNERNCRSCFKVFGAIEKNKVNVSMITQGSSELNLAFIVKNSDTNAAVRALHDEFALR